MTIMIVLLTILFLSASALALARGNQVDECRSRIHTLECTKVSLEHKLNEKCKVIREKTQKIDDLNKQIEAIKAIINQEEQTAAEYVANKFWSTPEPDVEKMPYKSLQELKNERWK